MAFLLLVLFHGPSNLTLVQNRIFTTGTEDTEKECFDNSNNTVVFMVAGTLLDFDWTDEMVFTQKESCQASFLDTL